MEIKSAQSIVLWKVRQLIAWFVNGGEVRQMDLTTGCDGVSLDRRITFWTDDFDRSRVYFFDGLFCFRRYQAELKTVDVRGITRTYINIWIKIALLQGFITIEELIIHGEEKVRDNQHINYKIFFCFQILHEMSPIKTKFINERS